MVAVPAESELEKRSCEQVVASFFIILSGPVSLALTVVPYHNQYQRSPEQNRPEACVLRVEHPEWR